MANWQFLVPANHARYYKIMTVVYSFDWLKKWHSIDVKYRIISNIFITHIRNLTILEWNWKHEGPNYACFYQQQDLSFRQVSWFATGKFCFYTRCTYNEAWRTIEEIMKSISWIKWPSQLNWEWNRRADNTTWKIHRNCR